MNVVIVHYHFKPGGVTTVMTRQMEAFARLGIRAFLVTGEEPAGPPGVPFSVLPALAYDAPGPPEETPETLRRGKALAASLAASARELAGSEPDLYYVHNPTIRKNAALCPALSELASSGARILVQAHDFAEDWRPDVLLAGLPYPAGCRWAVLNGRDYRALRDAGIPESALELLPNSLPAAGEPPEGDRAEGSGKGGSRPAPDLVLYPVRGIKRKNLGEALLLSLWLPPSLSAAVTLPPNNPRDFPLYESWKALAREIRARITFEAGTSASLDELYARTRTAMTASVKEGFGFAFLEPPARGVPVAGRRLSAVIPDFEARGIAYPGLYPAIRVPRGLFDEEGFRARLDAALRDAAEAFSSALGAKPDWLDERMREVRAAALPDAGADFGVLDAAAQSQVLERLFREPGAAEEMERANPFLASWWDVPAPRGEELAGLAAYSPERSAELLRGVCERTVSGPGAPSPDREALARALLKPEGFFCPGL